MGTKLKIAVVGGGAVAERVHLPALAASACATATAVVDASLDRAHHVATLFGVDRVAADYHDILDGSVDAAIVGLPHHLHAPVSIDLLHAGIHVLVEKPMALTVGDCERMIDAAKRSNAVLAVGLLRRCAPALRWIKHALDAGMLGRVEAFDVREGAVYRWPVASPSMFRRENGGVLADAGSHVLDLITWWFGEPLSVRYWDDADGGVEADCLVELEMKNGARGRIELSRTRDLQNACVITAERGMIDVGTKTDSIATVRWHDGTTLSSRATDGSRPSPTSLVDLFTPQLDQFVRAVLYGEAPTVSGDEARRSIELLSACYANRQVWTHPWDVVPTTPEVAAVAR